MKSIRGILLSGIVMMIGLLFLNCARPNPQYIKNGIEYGVTKGLFRARWWNFFERGTSFADGEFYAEAENDFKAAIRQRYDDKRRARTYGLHFIEYFPHRELGIVYFKTGRLPEAVKELEASLASEDNAKAKYFMNRCRARMLESTGAQETAPNIEIQTPQKDLFSNQFSITVEGDVTDNNYVSSVSINRSPIFIELAQKKQHFERRIDLSPGANVITVVAKNLLGKVTRRTVHVFSDRQGPRVSIQEWADGQQVNQPENELVVSFFDESGILKLTVDGEEIELKGKKSGTISKKIQLKQGKNSIELAAVDLAGNITQGSLNLIYQPEITPHKQALNHFRLAAASHIVSDAAYYALKLFEPKDKEPPLLRLRGIEDAETVYVSSILIEGDASDPGGIEKIEINGEPLSYAPSKTVLFNAVKPLKEGLNTFEITVKDSKGNVSTKTVKVKREVQEIHKIGSRMSVAVMPFASKGEPGAAGELIYDMLIGTLVEQERFHVVARGSEFEGVLQELKLSQTDLVDKSKAVKLGRMVAAECIFMGAVAEKVDSIEIYARLINTETGAVLAAHDVFDQDKSPMQLKYLLQGLALKFERTLPLIEGIVIKVDKSKLYLDIGSEKNVRAEMKCIIFRKGEPIIHPITGKSLGADVEVLGRAVLANVLPEFSIAELLEKKKGLEIQVADRIITK